MHLLLILPAFLLAAAWLYVSGKLLANLWSRQACGTPKKILWTVVLCLPVNPEVPKLREGLSLLLGALFLASACSPTSTEPPPANFVLLADAVKVTPEKDQEFEIVTTTFGNLGDYKEARIVWWAELLDPEQKAAFPDPLPMAIEARVADGQGIERVFRKPAPSARELGGGLTIRLSEPPMKLTVVGRIDSASPVEIHVAANFRRNQFVDLELNESDIRVFDNRYLDLQDNISGLDRVYDVEDVSETDDSEGGELFAFDYGGEIMDLFTPDSRIMMIEGGLEETCSVNDFVANMVRGHFSFTLRVETTSGPEIEVHSDHAILRAERKMHGQGGIGKPNEDLFSWSEEMRIERRDGRLAITSLRRTMDPGSE